MPQRRCPNRQVIEYYSAFLWNALGVPINQMRMFLNETTAAQYAIDTIDPVATTSHLRDENYHVRNSTSELASLLTNVPKFYLCLQQKYSRTCPPAYLSREGFAALKKDNGALMDSFQLHTDSIINVLQQLGKESLTVWVGMDQCVIYRVHIGPPLTLHYSMDWFPVSIKGAHDPALVDNVKSQTISATNNPCELTEAIVALRRALKPGGRAFWRSAAINPWYAKLFEQNGFKVERLAARVVGTATPIDNVNM